MNVTAANRSRLIRLASSLPKGDKDRRTLLASLNSDRRASRENGRLDSSLRRQINSKLNREGLDGNGRFRKAQQGYSRALEVLSEFGIELDTVVSSHLFSQPTGTLKVDVAYSHPSDPFSPVSITNSILYLQFTELRDDVFEVVAYMS